MAVLDYNLTENKIRQVFLEECAAGKFDVKSETEILLEALDKDHLQKTAAKGILERSGLSISSLNNASKPTIALRKKSKKLNEDTKQEETVIMGPIELDEEMYNAFKYVCEKFFHTTEKAEKK